MSDDSGQWWYCLVHKTVEKGAGCGNTDRLGPYASEDEAAHAIEKAAERTEQWDNDPRWKDDD